MSSLGTSDKCCICEVVVLIFIVGTGKLNKPVATETRTTDRGDTTSASSDNTRISPGTHFKNKQCDVGALGETIHKCHLRQGNHIPSNALLFVKTLGFR